MIAAKALDSNWIIPSRDIALQCTSGQWDDMNERGVKIVISQRPQRIEPLEIEDEMYKWRHLIENHFQKLKEFKRIAMRLDKTDTSCAAMINLCSTLINSR